MTDDDVSVTPHEPRNWKQTLAEPKVWVPVVAGVAVVGTVIGVVAAGAGAEPGSSATPSATATATASASASPSASATPSASGSPTPSESPTPTAEPSEAPVGWLPDFPMPQEASDGVVVASFPVSDAYAMGPVLSPDRSHVVAGRWGMDGSAWFVGAIDGSKLAQLKDVDADYRHDPVWSPSGEQVAYVKRSSGGAVLALVSKDGTGVRTIAPLPVLPAHAGADGALLSWSGDGKSIAVTQSALAGELEDSVVTVFDVKSGNSTEISGAGNAAFAPTGWTLAYTTIDSSGKAVLVKQTDGGAVKTLHSLTGNTWALWTRPTLWSPDGTRIAYLTGWNADLDGAWYSIRADGTGNGRLSDTYSSPVGAWSPDSRHFAAAGYDRLPVVAAADGSQSTELDSAGSQISWASSGIVVVAGGGSMIAIELATDSYAVGGADGPSNNYVVGADNVGVLVVVDSHSREGNVSVHKP